MLDTHRIIKRLRDSGASEGLAETWTDILREAREFDISQLATKADLNELRQATKADIAELRQATRADIAELKQATRADIAELKQATKVDIAELKQATKAEFAEIRNEMKLLEQRMTIKLGSMLIAAVAILGVLIKLI